MIHISDIRADLDSNDRTGIENAFRALVDFPYEDTIAGTSDCNNPQETLTSLLREVCEALADDLRIVPSGTVHTLAIPLPGVTYAEVAGAVLANINLWRDSNAFSAAADSRKTSL